MMPRRIGLAGRMGVGKSSVARRLTVDHGYVCLGFAQELRAMLKPAYGVVDKADTFNLNGVNVTGRELLQSAGAALRKVDDRVFLKAMARRLDELPARIPVVVDDVRMEAEADWLRLMGFTVVELTASEQVRKHRVGATWFGLEDITEQVNLPSIRQVGTDLLDPSGVVRVLADIEEGSWVE